MTERHSSFQLIWSLVRKDARILRRYLWIGIPVFLSYGAMFLVTTESYLVACSVFAAAAAVVPMWIDSANKVDLLFCSLPATRFNIVAGRYVSVFISILAGGAITLVYGLLLSIPMNDAPFGLRSAIPTILSFVSITYLLFSLFLPI